MAYTTQKQVFKSENVEIPKEIKNALFEVRWIGMNPLGGIIPEGKKADMEMHLQTVKKALTEGNEMSKYLAEYILENIVHSYELVSMVFKEVPELVKKDGLKNVLSCNQCEESKPIAVSFLSNNLKAYNGKGLIKFLLEESICDSVNFNLFKDIMKDLNKSVHYKPDEEQIQKFTESKWQSTGANFENKCGESVALLEEMFGVNIKPAGELESDF